MIQGDEMMELFEVKMIRKGAKPPIWRRTFLPSDITFAQLALILEDILEYTPSANYEFEFFQKRVQIREWKAGQRQIRDFDYDYLCASDTYMNELFQTEKWFSFRVNDAKQNTKEFRIEIEKRFQEVRMEMDGNQITINWPMITKQVGYKGMNTWSDCIKMNELIREKYAVSYGTAEYKSFNELQKEHQSGKLGLIANQDAINRIDRNEQSANSKLREITDQYRNTLMAEKKRDLSRNATVFGTLMVYDRNELCEIASSLNLQVVGLTKDEIARYISKELLKSSVMEKQLVAVDEEGLDAFEAAMKKGCYLPSEKEWALLEELYDLNYVTCFADDYIEIPKEVIATYQKMNTPNYRKNHLEISWMLSCLNMCGIFYVVAPIQIVYRMYQQRDGFQVTYDEFVKRFDSIPEDMNPCVNKSNKIILKVTLKDNIYMQIEHRQGNKKYYVPSVEEIMDYSKNGYPSQEEAYAELKSFLMHDMKLERDQADYLCMVTFQEFSMGGMLSDVMEHFNKDNIGFDSENQVRKFATIAMNVNNHTRMLDLRGHTPSEISKNRPLFTNNQMPRIVPMSSMSANLLDEARRDIEKMGFAIDTDTNATSFPTTVFQNDFNQKSDIVTKKVYPNDPCPCGSGKKFKKCCGQK